MAAFTWGDWPLLKNQPRGLRQRLQVLSASSSPGFSAHFCFSARISLRSVLHKHKTTFTGEWHESRSLVNNERIGIPGHADARPVCWAVSRIASPSVASDASFTRHINVTCSKRWRHCNVASGPTRTRPGRSIQFRPKQLTVFFFFFEGRALT